MRIVIGAIIGIVGWMLVATIIGFGAGYVWPEFAAASRDPLTLTTVMLIARLAISFVASLVSGWAAARFGSANGALAAGVLLLLGWGYYHVTMIWNLFPLWYHLTFLVSLPVLAWVGSRFASQR